MGENGKPKYLGPKTEGCRPSIAFSAAGDEKPTWWIYDPHGGECFYVESDADLPPRTGWRKQYGNADLAITLEVEEGKAGPGSRSSATEGSRKRSRSPRNVGSGKSACPW